MSFLTDLVEGHTDKLGTDISHAGSSFANHPMEWAELGGAAALGAAPFLLPELGGLLGGGAAAEGGGILTGGAALGVDPAAYAAASEAGAQSLGYGTEGLLTNAAGQALGAVDPLAQGAAGAAEAGAGGATPAGFAATDAELSGGITSVGGAPAAGGGGGGGGFLGNITNSLMHPTLGGVAQGAGVAAAGAGLGMNLMHGNQVDPNQQKLADMAQQLGSQGQVLESYLKTGKLPPALQASLDQAKSAAKARLISGYAQRGQSTDPRMNSALAQELNNLDLQAVADMAKIQVDMLNTGLKETGMSMELYTMLTQMDEKQNQDLMKSIQNMAMALGGGFGGSKAA